MQFTLRTRVDRPYDETVDAVRSALGRHGFGVLTEIDLRATLKTKLGVEIPPQVILGACRPQLAHQALQADPSVATLLPCNVVVRADGDATTVVEAFDPDTIASLTGDDTLRGVARDARARLTAALTILTRDVGHTQGKDD